jgi:2,4-dienoyl-CoA reductase-like NADH-dependent reductase (Old Yellow Enzyme family)/thioredoxin reductase
MAQIAHLKRVLSPLTIRGHEIKNRVVRTAHATAFADGPVSDQLIAYHLQRAQGGIGLSILEGAWVHESSRNYARNIHCWSDDVIPSYQKLMTAINPTGMKVIQQIWHGGGIYADWRQVPKGPSALPGVLTGVPSRELSHVDIQELVDAFTAAAIRCEKGGLHGVEVAGSHGYLVMQFLSPWSNQRTDEYGGSLENRMRFLRETLVSIRAAVADNFIVGLRLGPEDLEGGITTGEIIEVLKRLKQEGLIDYINMSMGGYHQVETIIPALHTPAGVELNWNTGVREKTGLTTFMSGRFRSLDEAEQVIAEGEADMVGMTRATIAEPHLVKKTIEQGADAPRPCIGCNQLCVGNIFSGQLLQCTVNVQVGREWEFAKAAIPKAATSKNILVVGGGPAGLEAARVAALAGHKVSLHEASPDLGGALRLVKNIPHLAGLADILPWLESQVYGLGVDVHTNSYLDADEIQALAPDTVLLATGSYPREDGWQLGSPGVQLDNLSAPWVVNSHDLLTNRSTIAASAQVLIVDDTGQGEAAGLAELLLSKGATVDFVCRFSDFAPQLSLAWRSRPTLRRLNATGRFTLHTHSWVSELSTDKQATVESYVGVAAKTLNVDNAIFVGYNQPNDNLAAELSAANFTGQVTLLGDCASPRYLHAAIHDGYNTALSL